MTVREELKNVVILSARNENGEEVAWTGVSSEMRRWMTMEAICRMYAAQIENKMGFPVTVVVL